MEMDVRLLVLTILSASIKAHEDGPRVVFTEKLQSHCASCLKNISSASCRLLDNGTISCIRCKENFKDGLLCSNLCSGGQGRVNVTMLHASCDTCVCNGSIDTSQLQDCNHMKGLCFICQSNDTRLDCEQCSRNNKDDDNSLSENCVLSNENNVKDNVEERPKPGFTTKEKIIVAVCSTFGVGCIAAMAFLIYRHLNRGRYSVKKPYWTVELTNRNYDDLDFSLLDPITDIPFVYRTDTGEFDNDALLGSEKPHLIMEVDGADVVE